MVLSRTSSVDERTDEARDFLAPVFGQRYIKEPIPRFQMPERELPREAAYQIVADQLQMDGKPRLNLASFVTTWMEPEADQLMSGAFNKNAIDVAEYPAISELQDQCVNMVARLFNAPLKEGEEAVGTATVGSSEAFLLAGLAMKRRWQHARKERGLLVNVPNVICGANTHVVIEKFANYFEVELRTVPVSKECPCMDPRRAVAMSDENTIGVVAILGSTYTGHFEDVKLLNDLLMEKNNEMGWHIPIHVDAASGGFVAPFAYPELEWDFRLPLVASINVSGHKYGLTYPGVGWVVWRHLEALPQDLVFHVSYLGEDQPTYTLNFSKSSQQIIGQYYQFIRLGREGYSNVLRNVISVAQHLRSRIEEMGIFEIYSAPDHCVPLVAFGLRQPQQKAEADADSGAKEGCMTERDIVDELRKYGWILPTYHMPPDLEDTTVMRVNVREDFSRELAEWFVRDLKKSIAGLQRHGLLVPCEESKRVARAKADAEPRPVEGMPSTPEAKGEKTPGGPKKSVFDKRIRKTNTVC